MNEKIDLTKILKDCPKGWRLYSTTLGYVTFQEIDNNNVKYPIIVSDKDRTIENFTTSGKLIKDYGECTLFPSKEQRDWSKFTAPWYNSEKHGKEEYGLKSSKDEDVHKFIQYIKKQAKAYKFNLSNRDYDIYAFAKDLLVWLEKQNEDKKEINNFDVLPGLYKCVHRIFDGTPDGRLLFEIGNVYKCLSKHDRAEFEVSYGHSVYLEDPVVCKYFIPFESKVEQATSQTNEQKSTDKIEPRFKVGDWVVRGDTIAQIVNIQEQYYVGLDINGKDFVSSRFLNGDKIHLWTINDAKDGDVLALSWVEDENLWEKIIIFKKYHSEGIKGFNMPCVEGYGNTFKNWKLAFIEKVPYYSKTWTGNLHPATKEQRDLLFQKIKETGYKWNTETNTFEKLVKPKFDPNTLQPFDKVLVRDTANFNWTCDLLSYILDGDVEYKYKGISCLNKYCIPYNDDTKHLLGTTDEAPEYYRYWED